LAVEAKWGRAVAADFASTVDWFSDLAARSQVAGKIERVVVYGGEMAQTRGPTRIVPWSRMDGLEWAGPSRSGRAVRSRGGARLRKRR
jgi:hypothetical protein